jgi:hypothetical protein
MAGLLGFALAGGITGAGEGGAKAAEKWTDALHAQARDEAMALRQESLARLTAQLGRETHAANLQTEIAAIPQRGAAETEALTAREEATRAGRMQTEREKGAIDAENKIKGVPQQLLDYYAAHARQVNAVADQINRGAKDKTEKPQLPNVKVEKDADGNIYNIDQNSGAIGTIQPGEPAQPGTTRWFSPDEPGKPAGLPKIVWQYNGQVLRNGLADLYPAIRGRVGDQPVSSGGKTGWDSNTGKVFINGQEIGTAKTEDEALRMVGRGASAAPPPHAIAVLREAVASLKDNPKLAQHFKDQFKEHYGVDPTQYLGKATVRPQAAPAVSEPESATVYDTAKAAKKSAAEAYFRYGFAKQRSDPAGFEAARQALDAAKLEEDKAAATWERDLGGTISRPVGILSKP